MTVNQKIIKQHADLNYKVATTQFEMNQIYDLRYEVAKDLYPHLFQSNQYGHLAKDKFDDASFHSYCKKAHKMIGCFRATPNVNNQWEINDSLVEDILVKVDKEHTLQYNRIYIDKNFRNQSIHEILFYKLSLSILENTQYKKYFAICNAGLVRMYKKIGAVLIYQDGFKLKNRLSHNYYLIGGQIEEFVEIIQSKYRV